MLKRGIVLNYYSQLFTSYGPSTRDIAFVMDVITARVTPDMNTQLVAPYTKQDIDKALSVLHPSKASARTTL